MQASKAAAWGLDPKAGAQDEDVAMRLDSRGRQGTSLLSLCRPEVRSPTRIHAGAQNHREENHRNRELGSAVTSAW